jgi:hypothetical protein
LQTGCREQFQRRLEEERSFVLLFSEDVGDGRGKLVEVPST